ncbi:hypothetical protein [Methanosarcina sp.]|uniref:hypothetical protein n=1 Tax=Methanosarcina sp. TaxID=2213 RepID=UPI003BB79F32
MKINRRIKFILIPLAIILNLILRYPFTHHEIGWDSFVIHILANSVSTFGYAKWWIQPASIGGFYPYSYASAVPFLLSGISQGVQVPMEWTIWLYSILMGLLSIFTAYIMAGAIEDNDIFKIIVGLSYSISTGVLYFTTWTVSTRGTFIVFLPLYIYLLIKSYNSIKYLVLSSIIIIVLVFTHHLFYYLIPITVAYFVTILVHKVKLRNQFLKYERKISCLIIPALFILMFLIPFSTNTLIESGSKYVYLLNQAKEYIRMIGTPIIFASAGFIYLILKDNKNFKEWFLILSLLLLTPLIYVDVYTKWIMSILIFILFGISQINIIKIGITKKNKYVIQIFIIILLISTTFSGYFQFLDSLNDPDPRYMDEKSYSGALWIRDNINIENNIIGTKPNAYRIFATSEVPTLLGSVTDIAYDFINLSELKVVQKYSFLSPGFYLQEPYYETSPSSSWRLSAIESTRIDENDSYAQRFVTLYNISYHVEDNYNRDTFTMSLQQMNKVYDNGRILIRPLS